MNHTCSEIYILRDHTIEGSPRDDGSFNDTYHLNGRIAEQARMMTPALSTVFCQQLETVPGFVELVDGIYIAINSGQREDAAEFAIQICDENGYRKKWSEKVPLNGDRTAISISLDTDEPSAKLASFQVYFPAYMLAVVSVSFHLRESLPFPPMPAEKPVAFTSPAYQEMIAKSLITLGHPARLKRAINKAKAGAEVTIAYIGGSITQGAGAKPINNMCYAKKSCEAFKRRFTNNGDNIRFVKAGIGGTPSQLGIARYERDILAPENSPPDIVIIEFGVNDYEDETKGACYESLCLKAYQGAGQPAVVLMFSVFANDENLEERLGKVGFHYGFPMVSAKRAVVSEYEKENPILTRRQYYHDVFHPSNIGHQIMADGLDNLWKEADAYNEDFMFSPEKKWSEQPIIDNRYKDLQLITGNTINGHPAVSHFEPGGFSGLDVVLQSVERNDDTFTTPQFTDNWHYQDRTAPGFKMTIACKDLLLLYKDTDDQTFAPAEIIIDGIPSRTIDPCAVGWTHCGATFILNGEEKLSHSVEIRPKTTEAKTRFTILGFGYTV